MKIFFQNYEQIEAFNKRENESYTRAVNENTGLTANERKKFRLGLRRPLKTRSFLPLPFDILENHSVPRAGFVLEFLKN
jgi:hypothetical protein